MSCRPEKSQHWTIRTGVIQLLALIAFDPDWSLLLMGAVIVTLTAAGAVAIRYIRSSEAVWSLQFILFFILSSYVFNEETRLAGWLTYVLQYLASNSSLFATFSPNEWAKINVLLFGSLLLTNEPNLWMRTMFQSLGLAPQQRISKQRTDEDDDELNAGRLIGILERNLMYIAVVFGDSYASVGFIIAAKGFARFKQMEDRAFAEYVLIGTLASTLVTLVVVAIVETLISLLAQ